MLLYVALVVVVHAANAQLCNFRRFPTKGCSTGLACNEYSGMCFVSSPSQASTVITSSLPLSYATTTVTTLTATPKTKESNYSTSTSSPLIMALLSTTEPVTELKVLPTYTEEAVTALPDQASSLTGMAITVICLGAIITLLLLSTLVYVLARVLRQPIDLFSTSADVFEMTFMSNS